MILEGNVISIDKCFGKVLVGSREYFFPLEIVYGDKIEVGDRVKIRIDNDFPSVVTKYEIIELEEFLDVD